MLNASEFIILLYVGTVMKKRDLKKELKEFNTWFESPEGQQAMKEAVESAMETVEKLKRQRKVSREMAERYFDI